MPRSAPSLALLLAAGAPFTLDAALGAGVTRHALAAAVARGDLVRGCAGVYVPAASAGERLAPLRAHALVVPAAAAFSAGTAAAALTGLDLPGRLTVTVPPGAAGRPARGCLRVLRRAVAAADVLAVDGVPLTGRVRTLLDLAVTPGGDEAVVLADALLHASRPGLLDAARARARAARRRGVRGAAAAEALLDAAEPRAESPQETRLRLALVAGGLPRPVAQHVVRGAGGAQVARVDLAYPHLRVAVEYDGRDSHPLGLARDRDRAWHLHRAGWLAVHVTAELLRRPGDLCRRVEQARAEQAGRRAGPW